MQVEKKHFLDLTENLGRAMFRLTNCFSWYIKRQPNLFSTYLYEQEMTETEVVGFRLTVDVRMIGSLPDCWIRHPTHYSSLLLYSGYSLQRYNLWNLWCPELLFVVSPDDNKIVDD